MGNILITGASKGIGKEAAKFFSLNKHRVFAGYRNDEDRKMLLQLGNGNIFPVALDVTEQSQITKAIELIQEEVGEEGMQGLVNNAGIAISAPMEYIPIDELRTQFEINFFGVVALTQACMPLIRKGMGRIVNISSISGMIAYPFVGPYASSKFALEAFTDSLRRELILSGIHVASVQPGNVDTPIWDTSIYKAKEIAKNFSTEIKQHYPYYSTGLLNRDSGNNKKSMHPQKVVDAIEHALFSKNPKTKYPVGKTAWLLKLFGKLIPDNIIDKLVKMTFEKESN